MRSTLSSPLVAVGGQCSVSAALWRRLAYAHSLLVAGLVTYFVLRIPLQLSDCLTPMLSALDAPSAWSLFRDHLSSQDGYFRPLFWAQVKLLLGASNGHYFAVFKAVHVLQITAVLLLFTRMLRVSSPIELAVLPFATAVLIGGHTFLGTVWEAFPVNHYLEILLACLVVVNLCASRAGRTVDAGAVGVVFFSLFTIETGYLVWLCLAAAYVTGLRGVSKRAVVIGTIVTVIVGLARFFYFDVGLPDLLERASGFGLRRLEAAELMQVFGDNLLPFYAHNIGAALLTVLFSEPRSGEFVLVANVLRADVKPWMVVNLVSSTLATLLIARFVLVRLDRVRRQTFESGDRIVLIFLAVLVANAVISFPYLKDPVVSPAGVFYAAATFFAVRDLLISCQERPRLLVTAAVSVLFFVLASGWAIRAAGFHYRLRHMAYLQRSDWAHAPHWLQEQRVQISEPAGRRLVEQLREQAIRMDAPVPQFAQGWAEGYVDSK